MASGRWIIGSGLVFDLDASADASMTGTGLNPGGVGKRKNADNIRWLPAMDKQSVSIGKNHGAHRFFQ